MNRLTLPVRSSEATKLAFKAYEIYKAKGFYNDQNNMVYDFLEEELLIPFTAREKLEILLEARKKIDRDIQHEKQRKRNILGNQVIQSKEDHHRDIPESKLIALHKYFRLLHREGLALPL